MKCMTRKYITLLTLTATLSLASCASTRERKYDPTATDAQIAFARLQLLAGHWNARVDAAGATTEETAKAVEAAKAESPAKAEDAGKAEAAAKAEGTAKADDATKVETVPIEYAVTSGGHALQEKLHAGEQDEMVTMYYLDGEGLALIHFCSMGNRPHMRLDLARSTRDDLRFEWDGTATDIDPKKDSHIHNGRIHFVDAETTECEWAFWVGGKESHRVEFTLSRANGGFTPLAK